MRIDKENLLSTFKHAAQGARDLWHKTPSMPKAVIASFLGGALLLPFINAADNEVGLDITRGEPCIMLQEAVNELHADSRWNDETVAGSITVGDQAVCDIVIAPR
jgi:hypothetical protein